VVLHRTIVNDDLQTLEVENKKFTLLEFTTDISGSSGVRIQGTFRQATTVEIDPYSTVQVAVLELEGYW
jgi:hypothetical protein